MKDRISIKNIMFECTYNINIYKATNSMSLFLFIGKLAIFPLISTSDIFSINELTLILNIIGQCDVKHIMTFPIKTITLVVKVSTYIITSMAPHPTILTAILVVMSVSTFKLDIILNIFLHKWNILCWKITREASLSIGFKQKHIF